MRRGSVSVVAALALLWPAIVSSPASAAAPIAVERGGDLFMLTLPRRVARLTETARRERMPVWSPDHRRLAFAAGPRALAWLEVETGRPHLVLRIGKDHERIDAIAWSPAGSRIVFSTHTLRGRGPRLCGQVWTVDLSDGSIRRLLAGQAWITGLGWSPDGRRILASAEWPNGIWVCSAAALTGVIRFPAAGGRMRLVADTTASHLDLSADGRRVVYRGWLRTCHACGEIWRSGADGTHRQVIAMPTGSTFGLYQPRFSPEGRRIAVLAVGRGGRTVWVMRPDGSGRRRVLRHATGIDW
jgi:Tol biopolymer transport system component